MMKAEKGAAREVYEDSPRERDDYWPRQERQLSNVGDKYFESIVEIPRISVGERQTIETLIMKKRYCSLNTLESKIQLGFHDLFQHIFL